MCEVQSCDGVMWRRLTEQFDSLGTQPEGLPEEALTQIYQVRQLHKKGIRIRSVGRKNSSL